MSQLKTSIGIQQPLKSNSMKQKIFKSYAASVCDTLNIKQRDLFSKKKVRPMVDGRFILYYLCFHRPMRIRDIQEYMADEGYSISHSAIIKGVSIITERMESDQDYLDLINKITNEHSEISSTTTSV
jgi:chromosomal replication initiation ATPase DnaA